MSQKDNEENLKARELQGHSKQVHLQISAIETTMQTQAWNKEPKGNT